MNKWVRTAVTIPLAVAVSVGAVFLFWFAVMQVAEFAHEERDYKTERLAVNMAHNLRYLAERCSYTNPVPSSTLCQETYEYMQNTCKGTVAPQLEAFCQDWEVITYVNANGSAYMIKLAQDIEEWLDD